MERDSPMLSVKAAGFVDEEAFVSAFAAVVTGLLGFALELEVEAKLATMSSLCCGVRGLLFWFMRSTREDMSTADEAGREFGWVFEAFTLLIRFIISSVLSGTCCR